MSKVIHISSVEEFRTLINNSAYEATIVDFSATWCGPCVGIAPYYEQLAKQNLDIQFLSVDVDEFPDISQEANVRAMPTFVVYQNGHLSSERVQGADRDSIDEMVARFKTNSSRTNTNVPENQNNNPSTPIKKDKKAKCIII